MSHGAVRQKGDSMFYVLIIIPICFIVLTFFFINSKSLKVSEFERRLSERKNSVAYLSQLMVSLAVALLVGLFSIAYEKAQLQVAERESAPLLSIAGDDQSGAGSSYVVTNEKGLASYLSLEVFDIYTFVSNERKYEIDISFLVEPGQGAGKSLWGGDSCSFFVSDADYDADEASLALGFALMNEHDVDSPRVECGRYCLVTCLDNDSNQLELCYREKDDGTFAFESIGRPKTGSSATVMVEYHPGISDEWTTMEGYAESALTRFADQ